MTIKAPRHEQALRAWAGVCVGVLHFSGFTHKVLKSRPFKFTRNETKEPSLGPMAFWGPKTIQFELPELLGFIWIPVFRPPTAARGARSR